MPRRGKRKARHTAKEKRIARALKRSNPTWSERRIWKTVNSFSSKQRGRAGTRPNTINYRRGRRRK